MSAFKLNIAMKLGLSAGLGIVLVVGMLTHQQVEFASIGRARAPRTWLMRNQNTYEHRRATGGKILPEDVVNVMFSHCGQFYTTWRDLPANARCSGSD